MACCAAKPQRRAHAHPPAAEGVPNASMVALERQNEELKAVVSALTTENTQLKAEVGALTDENASVKSALAELQKHDPAPGPTPALEPDEAALLQAELEKLRCGAPARVDATAAPSPPPPAPAEAPVAVPVPDPRPTPAPTPAETEEEPRREPELDQQLDKEPKPAAELGEEQTRLETEAEAAVAPKPVEDEAAAVAEAAAAAETAARLAAQEEQETARRAAEAQADYRLLRVVLVPRRFQRHRQPRGHLGARPGQTPNRHNFLEEVFSASSLCSKSRFARRRDKQRREVANRACNS